MTELDLIATGQTNSHIDATLGIHCQLVVPWQQLQAAAHENGFALTLASGFRSFERQLAIWNAKCQGARPLLDHHCQPLNIELLSPYEKVLAILRWSALPGASRHHWGSDIDVYDSRAVDPDYVLGLVPDEYEGDGPFAPMSQWLDAWLASPDNPGFFRPYAQDNGGVSPEPWHLSYRPIADQYQQSLTLKTLAGCLDAAEVEEKAVIKEHLAAIFDRFIWVGEI